MPLNVTVAINGLPLREYHIGRLEGGTGADDLNTYAVAEIKNPKRQTQEHRLSYDDFDSSPKFEHRYGDGVEVCVEKALAAIVARGVESFPKRD